VLLFAASAGWARYPSQILLQSTAQSSCTLHDGELATKPSRRWQPPRVTNTTALQLEHLATLDAISQCNHTRITHSQSIRTLASTSELEGSPSTPQAWTQVPRVPSMCQGRPHIPSIAPRAKMAVTPSLGSFCTDRIHCCNDRTRRSQSLVTPRAPRVLAVRRWPLLANS
jgi:hypothetical protein